MPGMPIQQWESFEGMEPVGPEAEAGVENKLGEEDADEGVVVQV